MSKRFIALLASLLVAGFASYAAGPDLLSVRRVGVDSLASFARNQAGIRFYIVNDGRDDSDYSVEASKGNFLKELSKTLQASGYSISEYDGAYFASRSLPLTSGLPAGYFDEAGVREQNPEMLKYIRSEQTIAEYMNKVYEIGDRKEAGKTRAYVSGYIRDVSSGEPLAGVSVINPATNAYSVSDAAGFYRLQMPVGQGQLEYIGYSLEDMTLKVDVVNDGSLDVLMKEKITSLKEVVVTAESNAAHRDAKMGIEKIYISEISKVPVAFGEADVLKVVLTLPGVKSVGEAATGFNVRGGSTDQNLVLFNDGTIYNPTHMFGIFSAFNADVISDVELYKASIPAQYGGRISSVMEVTGREGNKEKVTGSLGIGPLTARAHIEGPLAKGKTSFILGGRITYSNWMLKLLPETSSYRGGTADFADANVGITHRFSDKRSIQANAYWSGDRFTFSGDTTFRYGNLNASLKYRSHFSPQHSLVATVGYDQYSNAVDGNYKYSAASAYTLEHSIRQAFAKLDFKSQISERHTLSYGIGAVGYYLNPGHMMAYDDKSFVVDNALEIQKGLEPSAYLSDNWQASDKLGIEGGLRFSSFLSLSPQKFYCAPEVRISAKYSILPNFTFKAGFNTMNQYIHLISNTTNMSPMDAWQLCSDRIEPQKGWQGAGGLYLTAGGVDISLEGYWKQMDNYLDYKSGATLIMNPNLADDLVQTRGKAYGAEFMIKKPQGKLNGWISYTYSRTFLQEKEGRGGSAINGGDWYPASCDKPHDLKVVANYKFTHRFSVSVNLDYATGRPITLPIGSYEALGGTRLLYSDRNEYRIPDYFRLDAAINIEPGHYLKKLTHMSFTIGCYNVTGRKNAYSVYYTTSGGGNVNGQMLCVFASQIPYLNINIKF